MESEFFCGEKGKSLNTPVGEIFGQSLKVLHTKNIEFWYIYCNIWNGIFQFHPIAIENE